MKEYSYKDIRKITKVGIQFKDGYEVFFDECRNEWSIRNNIKKNESYCVAERDFLAKTPYFLIYSKNKIKILFNKKGFFSKKKNKKDFQNLQVVINRLGFSSYDRT